MDAIGAPRATVLAILVAAALLTSTFKQLIQSLYIGLSGREWLIRGSMAVSLLFLVLIGPIGLWLHENDAVQMRLIASLPEVLFVVALLKLGSSAWVATRLYDARLVGDHVLIAGAGGWALVVLATFGVLIWFMSTPFVPRYVLLLIAIVATPLTRISAAPLALAWNRHR